MSSVLDTVMLVIMVVGFLVVGLVAVGFLTEINTELQSDPSISNESKALSQNVTDSVPSILDYAFLFLLVGFWAVLLLLNYFLDTHPVFMVMTFVVMFAVMFVAGAAQDFFVELTSDVSMASVALEFPIANFVMNNFFMVFLVMAASLMLVLYSKVRGGQGI